MSVLAIVLIVIGVLVVLFLIGGLAYARRRDRAQAPDFARHVMEADQAFEQARAVDKGWDRAVMEAVVQKALEEQRPGFTFERLELVLVDDRPGIAEDKAHFVAGSGDEQVRVVLARGQAGWAAESVGQ